MPLGSSYLESSPAPQSLNRSLRFPQKGSTSLKLCGYRHIRNSISARLLGPSQKDVPCLTSLGKVLGLEKVQLSHTADPGSSTSVCQPMAELEPKFQDDEESSEGSVSHAYAKNAARKAYRIKNSTMMKLRAKTSSMLDVQNSPTWLRLDAIHDEHVRKVLVGSHWVLSDESNHLFGTLILVQSIAFGVELGLEADLSGEGLLERLGPVLYVLAILEIVFLIVFAIEYCLRSQALGQKYYYSISGVFDAVVLLATLAHTAFYVLEASSAETSTSSLQTIRTFRLLRIIRLLQTFPALAMLVKGLFSTFIAILDVMILLTALCYAGALLCCELLGSGNEAGDGLFNSIFQGFLTHIQLVLIEAWPDIAAQMMLQSYLWGIYVVAFLLVSNFAVLNLG